MDAKELTGKIKADTNGLFETGGAAAIKIISEQLLKPYVGDASFKSGLTKLGIGVTASYLLPNGAAKRMITTAEIIDGVEDLVYASGILGMIDGLTGNNNSNNNLMVI
ncbi:MAG: hypothetical protein LBU81_02795 [Methanosarcinales archaeon]|jgi:hypothetical protein|nr:hypothetical protein [Methanosarcinales archaeon]